MATKPAEFGTTTTGSATANNIAEMWSRWYINRQPLVEEWKEQRAFLFATDTTTTSQADNGWKNSTTLPKLTQVRDNLHSNYLSALFPNDDWLRWEAYTKDAATKSKANAIEAYMSNKVRQGKFRKTVSTLLYDYIDKGNCFATVEFVARYKDLGGEQVPDFIGPKIVRIAPEDIVFDPTANSFEESPKIIRSVRSIGEIKEMALDNPDDAYLQEAVAGLLHKRENARENGIEDNDKAIGYQQDGFGNLQEYYASGYVEFLEFIGDYHDSTTGDLYRNRCITVIDRDIVLRDEEIKSWHGAANIAHAGWRLRPDNLWAMGPLANLVGMQYRMDHLENAKADAFDLAIHPPLKIIGDVDEFNWGPGEELHMEPGSDVQEMQRNAAWVGQADTGIDRLESRMEQFAGAPREAMGIRTPGEKTAFEVAELQNASGRIFQEKITTFETEVLEPMLNAMLESGRRNLDTNDVIRTMDEDLGIQEFLTITREDITANGKLRPIGARHFATQAQLLQNLTQLMNSNLGAQVQPHTSGIALAKLVEDVLGLERRSLFKPNVAVFEQQQTQRLATQAQEDLSAEDAVEEPVVEGEGEQV